MIRDFLFNILYLYNCIKKSISNTFANITPSPLIYSLVDSNTKKVYFPLIHTNIFLNTDNINYVMQSKTIPKAHVWYFYLGKHYCSVISKPITDTTLFIKKKKRYKNKYISASYADNDIDKLIKWYSGPNGDYYGNKELKGNDISNWPHIPLIDSVMNQKKDNKIVMMDSMANNISIYHDTCLV